MFRVGKYVWTWCVGGCVRACACASVFSCQAISTDIFMVVGGGGIMEGRG